MIYGIGTDLLRVSRMAKAYERHGHRLCERILHPLELARLEREALGANFLAKCFAAKEATVKALGTGFRGVAGYQDVGWRPDVAGKPELVFSERLAQWMRTRGIGNGHLSFSDEAEMVLAMVVLERDIRRLV